MLFYLCSVYFYEIFIRTYLNKYTFHTCYIKIKLRSSGSNIHKCTYNFEHGIENKFSFSIFSFKKSKKNLSFVMAKMHLKYTVFFVCCCFDSCRYQIHALWSVTHIRCLPASHVAIDFGKTAVTTLKHCYYQARHNQTTGIPIHSI